MYWSLPIFHILPIGRCRSYAFVHHQSVMQWSVDRFKSYRDTLRENGFECHELKSPEGIEKLERPVGVFAANDDRGYDVIEFCRANHLRVPEDIAVISINNDTLVCENCHPRLSSIEPDFEQEGYLAAETLARMMSAAIRCGYENPNYLKNLFKRRFAMTMREFRNRS